jgi:uncharacterized protein (DUF4415 family)
MSVRNLKAKSKTDWERLKALGDDEIDFSDIPPLEKDFFANAELRLPEAKQTVTIRLDADVLDWFKSQGKGYQTRMNAVLRMYMEARRGPR